MRAYRNGKTRAWRVVGEAVDRRRRPFVVHPLLALGLALGLASALDRCGIASAARGGASGSRHDWIVVVRLYRPAAAVSGAGGGASVVGDGDRRAGRPAELERGCRWHVEPGAGHGAGRAGRSLRCGSGATAARRVVGGWAAAGGRRAGRRGVTVGVVVALPGSRRVR